MSSDHPPKYERLSTPAAVDQSDDTDSGTYPIRGVALAEGEVTQGLSGKKTRWDAEILREAESQLAGEQAKVLKGRPGEGHKPMDEQAAPEEIVGAVEYEYEEGVGLTYEGELVDEQMARRVDLGLVDVSPDIWRRLGDQNADGVFEVEEVIDIPYLTILDRGASDGASIEMVGEPLSTAQLAEYLSPPIDQDDVDDQDVEQLQRDEDPAEEPAPDVGDAVRWQSDAGGSVGGWRYGVVVDGLQDGPEDQVLVAVYEPGDDGWENRDEQDPIAVDSMVPIGSDGVGSLPAISQLGERYVDADWPDGEGADDGGDGGDASNSKPTRGAESPVDSDTTYNMSDDDTNLQEQLASVRQERDDLAERIEELEADLSEKEDRIEDLDEQNDQLAEEIGPFKELLAGIVAEDSPLDPETVAERFELSELVDQLAPEADDDDREYTEVVREQLGESLAPRGEGEDDGDQEGGGAPTEESDQLARSIMDVSDARTADQMGESPTEFIRRTQDVDPAEFDDEQQLRQAVRTNGGEN